MKEIKLALVEKENRWPDAIHVGDLVQVGVPLPDDASKTESIWVKVISTEGVNHFVGEFKDQPTHSDYVIGEQFAFAREHILVKWGQGYENFILKLKGESS